MNNKFSANANSDKSTIGGERDNIKPTSLYLKLNEISNFKVFIPGPNFAIVPAGNAELKLTSLANNNHKIENVKNQNDVLGMKIKEYYLVHDFVEFDSFLPKILVFTKDTDGYLISIQEKMENNKHVPFVVITEVSENEKVSPRFKWLSKKIVNYEYSIDHMFKIAKAITDGVDYERNNEDPDLEKLLSRKLNKVLSESEYWYKLSAYVEAKITAKTLNRLSIILKLLNLGLKDPILPQVYQFYALRSFVIDQNCKDIFGLLQNEKSVKRVAKLYFSKNLNTERLLIKAFIVISFEVKNQKINLLIRGEGFGSNFDKLLKTTVKVLDDPNELNELIFMRGSLRDENIFQVLGTVYDFELGSGLWENGIVLDKNGNKVNNYFSSTIESVAITRYDNIRFAEEVFNLIVKGFHKNLSEIITQSISQKVDPSTLIKKKSLKRK